MLWCPLVPVLLASVTAAASGDGADYGDSSRIINGQEVTAADTFPQMVSIQKKNGFHLCGGTIVNDNFVLTAAHCLRNLTRFGTPVNIVSSIVRLDKPGRKYEPVKMIMHEMYNHSNWNENDIGLIQVQPRFRLGKGEAAVRLPGRLENTPLDSLATVVGWGRVNETIMTNRLHMVNQTIIGNEDCAEIHGLKKLSGIYMCGTYLGDTFSGFCKGDSGGPLLVDGNVQVGVVSWYTDKCIGKPGVYTRVSHFIDWINDNIKSVQAEVAPPSEPTVD